MRFNDVFTCRGTSIQLGNRSCFISHNNCFRPQQSKQEVLWTTKHSHSLLRCCCGQITQSIFFFVLPWLLLWVNTAIHSFSVAVHLCERALWMHIVASSLLCMTDSSRHFCRLRWNSLEIPSFACMNVLLIAVSVKWKRIFSKEVTITLSTCIASLWDAQIEQLYTCQGRTILFIHFSKCAVYFPYPQ